MAYKCRPSSFKSVLVCVGDALNISCPIPTNRLAIFSTKFASASSGHIYCPLLSGVVRVGRGFLADQASREMEICTRQSATSSVMQLCHGQRSCVVTADPVSLGSLACKDKHVYMKTTYACVNKDIFLEKYQIQHNRSLLTTTTSTTTTTTSTTPTMRTTTVMTKENVITPVTDRVHSGQSEKASWKEEVGWRDNIGGGGAGAVMSREPVPEEDEDHVVEVVSGWIFNYKFIQVS